MSTLRSYAPLPLRLVAGFGFLYHGWPKLFSSSGHQEFVGMLEGIGIPAPGLMSWVVGLVEVGGGLAFILGAFTAIAGALLAVDMLVAIIMVHLPAGYNFMNITGMGEQGPEFGMPGYEVPLLYLAVAVSLALSGPGALAIESLWRKEAAAAVPREGESMAA